jgi:NAD(P)-dependent dehydrogenase (short-subunit alcohol dehydrogenase family)
MLTDAAKSLVYITGGTSGIGLATAQVLYEKGFELVVTGTNPETLAAAQRRLPSDVLVLKSGRSVFGRYDPHRGRVEAALWPCRLHVSKRRRRADAAAKGGGRGRFR